MNRPTTPFSEWLNATIESRGLTQAQLARAVGVADTQVSRWRRGQVVPTVRYLQQLADTLDVPRVGLDRLAGYPVNESGEDIQAGGDVKAEAELQACEARFRQLLEQRVPRRLWRAYLEACGALAASLTASFEEAVATAQQEQAERAVDAADDARGHAGRADTAERGVGFRP